MPVREVKDTGDVTHVCIEYNETHMSVLPWRARKVLFFFNLFTLKREYKRERKCPADSVLTGLDLTT